MDVHEIEYCNTNTYLIDGDNGKLLFDTGWTGSFQAFCNAMFRFKLPSHGILNVLDFFILLSLRFCQIVEFYFSYEDAVLQDKLQAHPE